MANSLLEAALHYATEKYWPVFPCRADKKPYTKHGFRDASSDPDVIKAWWAKWPHANIGFEPATADLVVYDFDPGHDDVFWETLPPTNLVAKTPRGGWHQYYQLAEGETVAASASKVAPHVDVRSFHSYVLLPPGTTADGKYEWLEQGKPTYRTDEMVRNANSGKDKHSDHDAWIIEPDLASNIVDATQWLINDAKIAIEGQGGDHTCFATAAMMKSFGISQELAYDLMREYWNPRCEPPWKDHETGHFLQKIENGYSYSSSPPGNITNSYKVAKLAQLFKATTEKVADGNEYKCGRFRVVNRYGIDSIKEPSWLIPGFIPEDAYVLMFGAFDTFKTFMALDIALSIATFGTKGRTWPTVSTGAVLFVAGEGRSGIKRRVEAWEKHHHGGARAESFHLGDPVPLISEAWEPFVKAAQAASETYKLVVLDTIGRSLQGMNENAQEHASKFTQLTEYLRKNLGCSVLALHHTGIATEKRSRGSSVFGSDADVIVRMERAGRSHDVAVHMVKQKDAATWSEAKMLRAVPVDNTLVMIPSTALPPEGEVDGQRGPKKIDIEIVERVLLEVLEGNPGGEWSTRRLAEAIADHDDLDLSADAVRKRYLPILAKRENLRDYRGRITAKSGLMWVHKI